MPTQNTRAQIARKVNFAIFQTTSGSARMTYNARAELKLMSIMQGTKTGREMADEVAQT
jgi:uncharacterized cupin superfamily protein